MPYQPEKRPPRAAPQPAAPPAAEKKDAKYQIVPEYSLETWKAPKAVQDAIEKFSRDL